MKFDHHHYVPCLRWKQGEYQALFRLKKATKDHLTPLIEVAEMGWDFETKKFKDTIDDHLAPVAKRIQEKWGRRCFVDLNIINPAERLSDGKHPVDFVFDDLRKRKCVGVPVAGLERDEFYNNAVSQVDLKDNNGICLRLKIEQAAKPNIENSINVFLNKMGTERNECDVILDLGSPNYIPIEGFSKLVQIVVQKLPYLNDWRTFSIIGGSFPPSTADIKGVESVIPRYEWLIYKELSSYLKHANRRIPTFGDYTISHPRVVLLDMRFVKPSAKLIYAIDDAFYVRKGPNVRDNGFAQYHDYCMELIKSTIFQGETYSEGDKKIFSCAHKREKPGNLTTWKWVGTNHHMERLVEDISSFSVSSNIP